MKSPTTSSLQNGSSGGFFSVLQDTFGNFVREAGSRAGELVPIWAAKQLGIQQEDQLDSPTFVESPTAPVSQELSTNPTATAAGAGLKFGGTMFFIILAGALGLVLLNRK